MSEFKEMNIYQKINYIMTNVKYVQKTANIGYGDNSYKAVTHDHVTKIIQPWFAKVGLVAVPEIIEHEFSRYEVTTRNGAQDRYQTNVKVKVTVINADKPDEQVNTTAIAQGLDTQDKSSGKAYSMAVKYCYLKLLMLESGDEEEQRIDDGKAQSPMSEYKAKQEFLDDIMQYAAAICSGKSKDEKAKWMKDELLVDSFNDLKKRTIEQLSSTRERLKKKL